MNPWRTPDWLEREVRERDHACVYCGIAMVERMPSRGPRGAAATWEHIMDTVAEIVKTALRGSNREHA
jgi:PleD family two-component response regulator